MVWDFVVWIEQQVKVLWVGELEFDVRGVDVLEVVDWVFVGFVFFVGGVQGIVQYVELDMFEQCCFVGEVVIE